MNTYRILRDKGHAARLLSAAAATTWLLLAGGCSSGLAEPGEAQVGQSLPDSAQPGVLQLSPPSLRLVPGQQVSLAAHVTYPDGRTEDVTAGVAWAVGNQSIAVLAGGALLGLTPGDTVLTATYAALSATADVRVASPAQDGNVTLDPNFSQVPRLVPASMVLAPGATARFTFLFDSDGSGPVDCSARAAWASDAPQVATVSADGTVTAVAEGTASVSAGLDGAAGTRAEVQVTRGDLSTLAVNGLPASLEVGAQAILSASGHYTGGATGSPPADALAWTVSDPAVATVDAMGTLTARHVGTAQVSVAAMGVASAPASLTVTPRTLVIASSASPSNSLAPNWGTWRTYAYGQNGDGTATLRYDPGAAVEMDFALDSGSYGGRTLFGGGVQHDLIAESVDRISFTASITGGLQAWFSIDNPHIDASNEYKSYGIELTGITTTPTTYTFTLSSLPWGGNPAKQNYTIQDALSSMTGLAWDTYGSGGVSGTMTIDNLTLIRDHL